MIEIKFFVLILGALTPPPRIEEPVMKIPLLTLSQYFVLSKLFLLDAQCTDHAAPTTERPIQRAIPVLAHA
jgi:hypothetical protein